MENQELIKHYERMRPILDRENAFLYFPNNKVAQTSINRHLLKKRVIVYKDDTEEYARQFDSRKHLFDSLYKFTIVRNPWDRVLSGFSYLQGRNRSLPVNIKLMSFKYFVLNVLTEYGYQFDAHFHRQYPSAFYKGKCFVDFVGKLESIKEDWQTISKKVGAPQQLPHKNRSAHKAYQHYYTPEMSKIVLNIYQEDIDAFGYTYNG